jgi:DNA-binding beta-propeller fold protein YncE
MRSLLLMIFVVNLLAAGITAAEPFVSAGFVTIPAEVKLGDMSAVAVDAKDNLYVLHRGQPPLLAFDADEKFLRGFGEGLFKVPHGLRIDREGNVWTTDNGNHVLRKFSADGKLLATLGKEGKAAAGKEGFRAPNDLVFDKSGSLYVADSGNGRIVKLAADGTFLDQWGSKGKGAGQFATAHSLAIDAKDRLFVGDRGNQRVQVFSADGTHLADYRGFGNPFGLLPMGEELLVSEGDIHKLFLLDKRGQIAAAWGDAQSLKLPHLMAVNSRGVIFVAEVAGKRVQKLKRP